jgi:Ca2+-binding EF-hand superfamily protein
VYPENEMHEVFQAASDGNHVVSFEQFIKFMVEVTEDQQTSEQVFQSFIDIANGKPYVTELDLQNSLVPDTMIEQLKEAMPPASKGEGMDYVKYMSRLTGHG